MTDPTAQRASVCPVCGLNDHVMRISTLVDSGTTSAFGQTVGLARGAQGGGAANLAFTGLNFSTSQSNLVNRFQPTTGLGFWLRLFWGIGIWFVACIAGFIAAVLPTNLGVGAVFGLVTFFSIMIAGYAKWVPWYRKTTSTRKKEEAVIRTGYYCQRDDAAFLPGATSAASPENFVQACVKQVEEQTRPAPVVT